MTMRKLVAALAAVFFCLAAAADADMVVRQGDLTVRLMQRTCDVGWMAARLKTIPQVKTEPKAAQVTRGALLLRACWLVDSDDDVRVVDENGGAGWGAMRDFKPAAGI